jgi:hypothetical protein
MLRPWKKRILPVALLTSCFWPSAALAQGLYQQYLDHWKHGTEPFEIWVFANGQKLAEFMPQPVPGLVEHLPWEPIDNYLPHFESYVHHQYLGFSVEKRWAYEEPSLFRQVEQAQQARDEARQALNAPENAQKIKAWQDTGNAVRAQYAKESDELMKQGKYKEASELMEKLAKDPSQKEPELFTVADKAEQRLRDLQGQGRKLILEMQASYPPLNWALLKQIGTLKGYPLFRGVQQDVFLAVYVGPKGFRNPPVGKEAQKRQMKCFLAQAQFPPGEKYEALARQMLEKIDYDGLAKLVEP